MKDVVGHSPNSCQTAASASSSSGRLKWSPYFVRYLLPLVFISVLLSLALLSKWEKGWGSSSSVEYTPGTFLYKGNFSKDFNDLNEAQLEVARRIGISPLKDRDEASTLPGGLQEISSCKYYHVDRLTHSVPFLIPPAALLLEDIGRAFRETLEEKGLPLYRPIVTSVTRTLEDLGRLRSVNLNASENSTHLYGTTFDISWKRFDKVNPKDPRTVPSEALKHLLARVLADEKGNGHCFVKHEVKQACFHITVRKE